MKSLLKLGSQEIQSGLYMESSTKKSGTSKAAVPLWADGKNVLFKEFGFKRLDGADPIPLGLNSFAADILAIRQAFTPPTKQVYLGLADRVQLLTQDAAGNWSTSTLASFAAQSKIVFETWGTWLLYVGSALPLTLYDGATVAPLAGTPFSVAQIVKRKNNYLLAFNTSNGQTMVEWSDPRDITIWTAAADNRAGNFPIRDLDSGIVAVTDLGNSLAIYTRSRMAIGQYLGGNDIWGFKLQVKGIGAISPRSVVTLDPYNYGLTKQGIFKTDGTSFVYLDDPRTLGWMRELADWTQENRFFGFHDSASRALTWFFYGTDTLWHSVSYNYENQLFTVGDLQVTAADEKEVFNAPLVAKRNDATFARAGFWQETETFFGTDVSFSLQTKPIDFGDRSIYKHLQAIRVEGVWDASTRVELGALSDPEASPTVVFDAPLVQVNYPDFESPYFTLRFYGTKPCKVTGIEFMGELGGAAL